MSTINKPAVIKLYSLVVVVLILFSACVPGSTLPRVATVTESYSATVTSSLAPTATNTPTPVPPSHWAVAGTVGFPFPPTVDPSNNYLPELLTLAEHFSPSHLSPSEQAEVYAAVIRRLAGPDDSFGGALPKPFLFIMTATDDRWGDHTMPTAEPHGISPEVQHAIQDLTADMPNEIKWVDRREEVKLDPQQYHYWMG